jgi:tripeptide aminopeptidase
MASLFAPPVDGLALRATAQRHHPAIVATQRQIAEIAAPTGQEAARADHVARHWASLGEAPSRDAVGNVMLRLAGSADVAPLVIMAHLDTVFGAIPQPRIREEGARLVGPGIGDNARGLAVLCALPTLLADAGVTLRRPIELVATVGEEGLGDLRGARHYLATASQRPFAVIALDSPGDEQIIWRSLGVRRYRITVGGTGGHSWNAYGTRSALSVAMALAQALEAIGGTPASVHRGDGVSVTVASLHGGSSINAIPSDATLDVDMRAIHEESLLAADAQLRRAVDAMRASEASITIQLEAIGRRPAGETDPQHELVRAAVAATSAVGATPQLTTASTGASAAMAAGISAVAMGAGGRGGGAHTDSEWFDPTTGARGVERLLRLLLLIAGG